jgi:dihydroorotate dehydrogenase (fumarate)
MIQVTFGAMLRAFASVALALTLALLPALNPVQAAPDTESSQENDAIAVNPATNGGADKSRTRFDYQVNPGQPARDSIYVVNSGDTVQEVTLYARDAYSGEDGSFLIDSESETPTDVGSWVIFEGNKKTLTLTLKPGNFVTIPFDVFTPTDASPGDHAGAIVASAETKGSKVDFVRRLAIRLYARVSGQIKARLEVTNIKSEPSISLFNPFEFKQKISYDITNVGNIELSADVVAKAEGPFGLFAGNPETIRISNMLPGNTRKISQTVSGGGQLFLTRTTIIYEGLFTSEGINAQIPRARYDLDRTDFPAGTVLYCSILILILLILLMARRRQKRSKETGVGENYN